MSTGKSNVHVGAAGRAMDERTRRAAAERRARELARIQQQRLARERAEREAQRARELEQRRRIDAEAERTLARLRARRSELVEAAQQLRDVLGEKAPLAALPELTLERASGSPIPATWLAATDAALQRAGQEILEARGRATSAAIARLEEAGRTAREAARAELAAMQRATEQHDDAPAEGHAPGAWRTEAVAAAQRNVARLAAAQDLSAHERGSALMEQVAAAVGASDRAGADERLTELRRLVQHVAEERDLIADEARRARDLRDHLERLHGTDVADPDLVDPELTGHLDRVALGVERLDHGLARRVSDHVIAESLAIALESEGYAVGESFTLDLVEGRRPAVWRDAPDGDGHAVRFTLESGSVIDYDVAVDAAAGLGAAAIGEIEQRWCDEDLPLLADALASQGVAMPIDGRSRPGQRPPELVDGLRIGEGGRTGSRRRAEEPRAREVRG